MNAPQLDTCIPVPLDESIFSELVDKTKDWALMHGAAMRSKTNFNPDALQFAPFALLPSTFPRVEFEKAVNIQTILNELIHKVAHDYEFLSESLKSTIAVDDFTRKLFEIYETVRKEGVTQAISLSLLRADYLLDFADGNKIKQVEINSVASSFGGISTHLISVHRFVLQELGRRDLIHHLPENKALSGLCTGMIDAWKIYGNPKAVIMFIVEDVTYNICDQRFHEFEIARLNPDVKVIRRTLTEVSEKGALDKDKKLSVDGYEVAVVYFRSGYEPVQYHGDNEWDARLIIERSLAIKCPSIHYHLAGTKKVQQALARPNVVEKYLTDPKKVESVREICTGLYSLDFDEYGEQAVSLALSNPEKFVLKPQREGGGNNVYGLDVRTKIEEMKNLEERTAWILMERIFPPTQLSYVIRPGQPSSPQNLSNVVSELGIFGVVIGDKSNIMINRQVGHMLRTKLSEANEGGVAAGSGCLDSPFLVDS